MDKYLLILMLIVLGGGEIMAGDKESIKLTPVQRYVTMQDGTEPPFDNAYWNNKEEGIYVDIVSGEALFSSVDKFRSGTGWPSFSLPIDEGKVIEKKDGSRTEVRSEKSDIHLGHVFDDGPKDKGGRRFCVNSASLKFVPVEEMQEEGYAEYLYFFKEKK